MLRNAAVATKCDCPAGLNRGVKMLVWNGAGDRIRTGDIDLGKVALYQLSYSRIGRRAGPLSRPQRALSNALFRSY